MSSPRIARPMRGASLLVACAATVALGSVAVGGAGPFVALARGGGQPPLSRPVNPVQKAGKYQVELRVPPAGVYAGEEIDIEFRVTDTSRADPVLGAPGVVRAQVKAVATMPSMASMPALLPKIHTEGVPGDYGMVTRFPHGGEYEVALSVTPPGEPAPFTVKFRFAVREEDENTARKPTSPPYFLDVRTSPAKPSAGQPTTLTLRVLDRATKKPVTRFDEVHTELMHLIMVRADLGVFFHEHPKFNADGTFTITHTFPTAGEWKIFGDCAPSGAGSQVTRNAIRVGGPNPEKEPLRPVAVPEVTNAGLTLKLKTPPPLTAKTTRPLTFALTDATGQPVTDLQPWLGAMAHLILIQEDAQTFVHSHPDEADPNNGKNGTLTFLARFPKPGVYKGWAQFQRAGQVVTMPFVVRAMTEGG